MLERLDEILLSDNVVENFENFYANRENKAWICDLLPEVEACRQQKQDTPWHIYTCLGHILHSVENMNKMTNGLDVETRRMLAYTMFLHDMGKPECYIRRFSRLYGREVDSFFNHNNAGVKIANRVLPQFNFDQQAIKQIEALIEDHDMFMFITLEDDGNPHHSVLSREIIEKEVAKLNNVGNGVELMRYLAMVGRADNQAQNPQMTGNAFRILDKIDYMLTDKEMEAI